MAICPRTLHTTVGRIVVAALSGFMAGSVFGMAQNSPRAQVTVENWDKGGAVSHWVYTHVSEVFPSAVIHRGGPILDLAVQIQPSDRCVESERP